MRWQEKDSMQIGVDFIVLVDMLTTLNVVHYTSTGRNKRRDAKYRLCALNSSQRLRKIVLAV